MKVNLIIDPSLCEPELEIRAPGMNPEIELLLHSLNSPHFLTAKDNQNQWVLLDPKEICRIWADQKTTWIKTEKETYRIAASLTSLEQRLQSLGFIRISSSEIIQLAKIRSFDLSMAGTVEVFMKNGDRSYVSRRNVPKIKDILKGGRQ